MLNSFMRIGNAAFVPALSMLKTTKPRADEILSDLIKNYDHNVFFQGDRDFAYDGDVVFHEFMHAVTASLINKLNAMGINAWGIHSEPGSLNEAWSDYFAAAFSNHSSIGAYAAVKGGFGEASMRNIDNNMRCPQNVIGEIHNDGQVWSGALWQIREEIKKRFGEKSAFEFDRAVLASLAEAKTTEDWHTQSEKLLVNIGKRPMLGKNIVTLADKILTERGVKNCFRAYALSNLDKNKVKTRIKNMLFVPSKLQIGLKNYAPAGLQFEVALPRKTRSVTLSFRQYMAANGALLGNETTPNHNTLPILGMVSFGQPIVWKFRNAVANATKNGESINEAPSEASYENGYWKLKIDLKDACQTEKMYISLLSRDFKYVLEDVQVSFDIDRNSDESSCQFSDKSSLDISAYGCSTKGGRPTSFHLLLMALFIGLIKVEQNARIKIAKPKD
jgi:hypothetical protein